MEPPPDRNCCGRSRMSKQAGSANIIKIFVHDREGPPAYIVVRYFPGTTLEQYCGFQNLLPCTGS